MTRPRTNWDTNDTPGVQAYRRRRREKLDRMGSEAERRGRTRAGDQPGTLREGDYLSPNEQAESQDVRFGEGGSAAGRRDSELRRRSVPRGGGMVDFTTGETTMDYTTRTGEEAAEAMESYDRRRRRRRE